MKLYSMLIKGFRTLAILLIAGFSIRGENAEQLLSDCEEGNTSVKTLTCIVYLTGFVSGINAAQGMYTAPFNGQPPVTPINFVNLPKEGVSPQQARRIVVKYMQDHPESLHKHEDLIILAALLAAFPPYKQP